MKDNMYFDAERDEDFNNIIRVFRRPAKNECIDDKKALGISPSDARKQCRKEFGGNILVGGAKFLTLAVPRGAFLTLVRMNYRGLASRMQRAKLNEPNIYNSAMAKFKKLGGNQGKFESAINFGKNKKPLACGKKCKEKKGLNFGGNNDFSQDELDFFEQNPDYAYSNEVATATVTASIIASASAILVPIIGIIGKGKMTKLEAEIDREEAEQFAEQQEAQYEEDEKKRESNQKMIKVALVGGSILVAVLITGAIVMKVIRKKRGK
jgi:hypothetical protein